jgi:hypothetical protein
LHGRGIRVATKAKGTLARPPWFFVWLEVLLLFLCFLLSLFLCCHVSILPFHFSWMRSELRKTAIDECIDSLKIEVKKKIDVNLDSP